MRQVSRWPARTKIGTLKIGSHTQDRLLPGTLMRPDEDDDPANESA
jgi:hypothetical protein